ncbi:MAG: 30S ribosomal protein S12 methylthiotransferase RimO [Oligoflexia bacterium]|nr:30S ribosomal protein S12 methylthiotransferase RimO [Oligoflexia bacterium]
MTSSFKILDQSESGAPSCGSGVSMNIRPDALVQAGSNYRGRAAVITLGCAKNQVDSEVMLGVLKNSGYEIVSELELADVAVVNTCGFLESAIKESIDCILEVSEQKKSGRLRKLLVAGCLVERYRGDLASALPEVDAFISVDDVLNVSERADGKLKDILHDGSRPYFLYDDSMPRFLSTKRHTAYVKVSEGCDRPCTFCIIPKLRGAMRSRSISSVVKEVQMLGAQGVREVNLVAQDLTSFGKDRPGERLVDLLSALNAETSVDWIRLLYSYPIGIDEQLLRLIADSSRICKYLDLPLQHSSERLLKIMKRPIGRYAPRALIEFITAQQPSIHLRTTFIVGFPGETEEDVDDLVEFVAQGHFTNVGVFTYSREQGTPAFDMPGQIPQKVKDKRRERVMLAQQQAVQGRLSAFIGRRIPVLLEGQHEDTDLLLSGRSEFQAPDVDGQILINDADLPLEQFRSGNMVEVEITELAGYDLVGKIVRSLDADSPQSASVA